MKATISDSTGFSGKLLLSCILSSLLYVITDILAGLLWEGYSFTHQAVSELSAIGAPTRPLVVPLLLAHDVLVIAFGLGVWRYSRKRPQRLVGGLLIGYAIVGLVGAPFPIHLRGAQVTFTDIMHSALTGVTVLLILLGMGFGAIAYGKRFRLYSIGTLLIILLLGAGLGFVAGAPIAAQGVIAPPQWFGLIERINIYGFMSWMVVLAIVLLRAEKGAQLNANADRPG